MMDCAIQSREREKATNKQDSLEFSLQHLTLVGNYLTSSENIKYNFSKRLLYNVIDYLLYSHLLSISSSLCN